jgi:hypothetical protein
MVASEEPALSMRALLSRHSPEAMCEDEYRINGPESLRDVSESGRIFKRGVDSISSRRNN